MARKRDLVADALAHVRGICLALPEATERLSHGAPTFFVGEEIFFGKDRLRDVEDLILASE